MFLKHTHTHTSREQVTEWSFLLYKNTVQIYDRETFFLVSYARLSHSSPLTPVCVPTSHLTNEAAVPILHKQAHVVGGGEMQIFLCCQLYMVHWLLKGVL